MAKYIKTFPRFEPAATFDPETNRSTYRRSDTVGECGPLGRQGSSRSESLSSARGVNRARLLAPRRVPSTFSGRWNAADPTVNGERPGRDAGAFALIRTGNAED